MSQGWLGKRRRVSGDCSLDQVKGREIPSEFELEGFG